MYIEGVSKLMNEQQVREMLGQLLDPFLHKTLLETNGIKEVSIKEEKNHVSVKLAIAKTNTAEQMQLQMKVVDSLKQAGIGTVGIRLRPCRSIGTIPWNGNRV